jgi:hypothetical protein
MSNNNSSYEWAGLGLNIVVNLYTIIGALYSVVYQIASTMEVYRYNGPVAATFWFFTVGPLMAALAGTFWPVAVWFGWRDA